MRKHSYVYNTADVPLLKHSIRWLVIFSLAMIGVIIYQTGLMFWAHNQSIKLDLIENIAGIVCVSFGFLFVMFEISQIAKNLALIKRIKKEGSFTVKTTAFNFAQKNSLGYFIRLFEYIMLIITTVCVFGLLTYSVWTYIFNEKINYFVPIAIMLVVANNYSCKNIEIKYIMEKNS